MKYLINIFPVKQKKVLLSAINRIENLTKEIKTLKKELLLSPPPKSNTKSQGINIPKKVKIGGLSFDVKETDVVIIDNNCNYSGVIRYSQGLIEIKKDISNSQKEQTFLHEILHGIVYDRNIELPEDEEENIIDSFASGMLAFIKDNPNVFKGE